MTKFGGITSSIIVALNSNAINNSIMKNYDEIRFYNDKVMERILRAKMLAYYQKQVEYHDTDDITLNEFD